jgi:hypothetical protein
VHVVLAVRVEAAVAGRRRAGTAEHAVDVDLAGGAVPLRVLVAAVVRAEVAGYEARAEERSLVRVLTERDLREGQVAGVVRSGGEVVPPGTDVDDAVDAALLAHRDGLYRVIVDDEPIDDLDADVVVGPQTRLLFLRLVALAGG